MRALIIAAAAVLTAGIASQAQALNPQPDPPGKARTIQATTPPDPCRASVGSQSSGSGAGKRPAACAAAQSAPTTGALTGKRQH